MRICKHCGVRIELIDCADGYDRWMHKVSSGPGPPTTYQQCKLPPKYACPHGEEDKGP